VAGGPSQGAPVSTWDKPCQHQRVSGVSAGLDCYGTVQGAAVSVSGVEPLDDRKDQPIQAFLEARSVLRGIVRPSTIRQQGLHSRVSKGPGTSIPAGAVALSGRLDPFVTRGHRPRDRPLEHAAEPLSTAGSAPRIALIHCGGLIFREGRPYLRRDRNAEALHCAGHSTRDFRAPSGMRSLGHPTSGQRLLAADQRGVEQRDLRNAPHGFVIARPIRRE